MNRLSRCACRAARSDGPTPACLRCIPEAALRSAKAAQLIQENLDPDRLADEGFQLIGKCAIRNDQYSFDIRKSVHAVMSAQNRLWSHARGFLGYDESNVFALRIFDEFRSRVHGASNSKQSTQALLHTDKPTEIVAGCKPNCGNNMQLAMAPNTLQAPSAVCMLGATSSGVARRTKPASHDDA
jgi:hypothetical protein